MITGMSKRPYQMARRAQSRDETRARIVAAAIALHEELGPKATTISAIAERAGVQRLTVYRHFPDDASLFEACSSGWYEDNPFPDFAALEGIGRHGCREALAALYRYYGTTRGMWASVLRDAPDMPVLAAPNERYRAFLAGLSAMLIERLTPPLSRKDFASATVDHAVRFATWQSLEEAGLGDEAKADLVMGWLE